MTDYDLGKHKRGDALTFTVDLTITIDGTDVTDLSGWDPVCQFRPGADSATVYEPELLDITGTALTFGIDDTLSASMAAPSNGEPFKGEVQVTNPDAGPGYGTITWPGEDGYMLLTMAKDVVRVVTP